MPPDPDAPRRSQSANLLGADNVNVQIQGDNNVVHIGRSRLDLTLYRGRRREAVSSPVVEVGEAAEILSPYAMAVPLVGRERELADLWVWMNGNPGLSIRVVTAPGGAGKTRLALELCEEAVRRGWYAGFVKASASLDSVEAGLSHPTLAVVDYAAAWLPWLRLWLDNLASEPPAGGKLRILLLERFANPNGGWWAEIFQSGGWGDNAVQARLDPAGGPYVLAPLGPAEDRRQVLEEVFKKAGSNLRLPRSEEGRFDRDLAELNWGGEPLFLLMAGLIAAREGFAHVLTLNRADLAFEVARRHELNRIGRIGESRLPNSRALVCHMAAYATLCQGLTRDQVEEAVVFEKRALRFDSVGDSPQIYRILHVALPRAEADVAPIVPDMVGEAAILLALGDGNPDKARESVVRAAAMAPERVPAVVIRMAQDFGGVNGRPVEWLDCLAERAGDTQTLLRLVNQLPQETLALREIAARLTAAVVERLRVEGDKEKLAGAINNLSVRLRDLGRHQKALEAVQKAVALYRELSQSRPDAIRPGLAVALNNLSLWLSALGRYEEALVAVQESMGVYRELSQSRPDAYRSYLATSLNNLSTLLGYLGRREEALAAVQEAVDVYRELSQARLNAFLSGLAMSLHNLANQLSTLGHREEALAAVQESLCLYHELSQSRPDAFRPDVAMSLITLSNRLRDLGRLEEALAAVRESVEVYRNLSQLHSDAFCPNLAASLNNLSAHLSALELHEEALVAAQEAVEVYRELSQLRPDAFRPNLAASLNTLSSSLSDLGRCEEALAAVQESVVIRRELSQSRPEAFRPALATSLRNLSKHLSNLGRRKEALEAAQESVAIRHELSQSRPDAFRPDLAASLYRLALCLQEFGRLGEGLEVSEEAVRMLLPFFHAFPAAFWDQMPGMIVLYLSLSEENDRQPDPELVAEIASLLEPFEPSPDPGSPL